MSFATEYLEQLERFAALTPLPRVRALHLPPRPQADARGDGRGEFCALELADGALGLSYVLLDGDTLDTLRGRPDPAGADALALARRYASGTGAERTLGLAAANALTRCLFDRAGFVPPASRDSLGLIDPQPGEHVGMIGLFRPLVGRALAAGVRLTVVELRADLAGEHAGWRVSNDARDLATCTQVLASGTLLLNDTLEPMLERCRGARHFALVGPSVGCVPDALFARGVTLLGGSWVTEPRGFAESLRAGRSCSAHARKFALGATDYPGLAVLLARL
jgi:uncharacterized protein (DUF4213/DUF364 family)